MIPPLPLLSRGTTWPSTPAGNIVAHRLRSAARLLSARRMQLAHKQQTCDAGGAAKLARRVQPTTN